MPGLPWVMSGKPERVGSGDLNFGGEEEGLSGGLASGILLGSCGDFSRKACRDLGAEDKEDGSELVHAEEGLSGLRIPIGCRGRPSKSKGEKEVRMSRPKRNGRDLRTSAGQVSCLRRKRYWYAHFRDVSSEALRISCCIQISMSGQDRSCGGGMGSSHSCGLLGGLVGDGGGVSSAQDRRKALQVLFQVLFQKRQS